ncbi:unnamed protein product [Ilex paraguariensis]|uniref:Transmembrane protein n=1 Tax=Ilex paraguariensis TaxID=185542 RepID=A0ABC8R4F6_9AQUA
MEEEREGDIRVPLISALFCLFVISGGVFLVVYVYAPNLSEPWFPMAAFLLIGSPWIFWFLTYIYTCIKACFRRNPVEDRQISRRGSLATPPPKPANTAVLPSNDEPPENSPKDGRHVHFGEAAVVVKGEDSGGQNGEHGGGEESSGLEDPSPRGLATFCVTTDSDDLLHSRYRPSNNCYWKL